MFEKERLAGSHSGFLLIAMILIAISGAAAFQLWRQSADDPKPPVNLSVPATPTPEVKREPKIEKPIQAKTVKVYPAAIKNKLKLPEIVQDDPALDVVASHQVKADDHPQTVTTLINTDTGDTETYVRRDPLPWLAYNDHGEAGIALVLRNGEPAVRIDARQNLFQVKAVHFGGIGSVAQGLNGNGDMDWELGVRGWVSW